MIHIPSTRKPIIGTASALWPSAAMSILQPVSLGAVEPRLSLPTSAFSGRISNPAPQKLRSFTCPPAYQSYEGLPRLKIVAAELTSDTLARSAQGDSSAFAEIVREHQAMVFSIAYHFLHDRWLAEELAQEVFLQLHKNLAGVESPAHLKFWLRKVASHRSIDQARRRKLQPKVALEEIPEPAIAPQAGDPMLAGKLRRLVAALPEKSRLVVILRYQEDLEPAEIAEVLEMKVRTVKSHLQRSLALLREKLARRHGELHV